MWILDPVANEGLYNLQDPLAQNSRTHYKKYIIKGIGGMVFLPSQALHEGWGFLSQKTVSCRHVQPSEPTCGRWGGLTVRSRNREQMSGIHREGWEGKSSPSPQRPTCRLCRERFCAQDQLTPQCVLHQNGNQDRLTNGNFAWHSCDERLKIGSVDLSRLLGRHSAESAS